MKQLFILIIVFAWTTSSGLHSQTIADTLEMAYNHFNNKDYQKAATHFDYFLSKVTGQFKDYYLAGVCKANLGASEKSMDYLNKAANGIAEYYMMKNDPGLKAVQGQINEIISRFDNFDKAYKLVMEQYPRKKSTLFAADSLYHLLPSGKIPKKQLKAIAYEFLSQTKDTFRFFYYLTEQLKTYQGKDGGKDIVKELQSSVKTYKNKIGKTTLGKLLEIGEFRYFYAMSFAGNIDSLRYHLSKVPYNVSMSCMTEDGYLLSFEYFTEQGHYNQAFSHLYSALASGHTNTKKIFESKACPKFFNQPVGKAFLVMLLSESVIPSIESSDRIFVTSGYEYSSSKIQNYEFLQAMNFNTRIPELKKYQVSSNVFGPQTPAGKSVKVSDSYPYGLYEDEFGLIIDSALNVTLAPKKPLDIFNPKDEVLVVKNTPALDYAYSTGPFYRHPFANIPFILAVKNGKVRKSIIPSVRDNYFQKLVPYGIRSVFYNKPDREELRYFAFAYGYNAVESYFEELMRSPRKEDIEPLAEFIPNLGIKSTAGFGFLVRVLGNPEEYKAEKKNRSRDDAYYNLKKIAGRYIEDLSGKTAFANLQLGDPSKNAPAEESILWKDAATKIATWWEQYKRMPPGKLPTIVNATVAELTGLPENSKSLFLNSSNRLLFYNPSEKQINTTKEAPKQEEEVFLMVEDIAAKTGSRKIPEISATMVGDTGYVFSPNHLDRPANLSIVPGLTEKELNDLNKLYENLGLSKNGRNIIAGDYDKSYDKFYVCRYNKQIAVFWFANTTLHASFMGPEGELKQTPVILLKTRELKCGTNDALFQQMVYNINSLQFDRIGNNLVVVCNASIKEKPGCSNQKSRIYAQLLGMDLKPVAEKFDIIDPAKSSESDFATYIAASGTNAYIFAQSRNASNTIYGTALNAKFEVTDTFCFGQDIEAGNNHKPLTLLKDRGGKMYCLYSQELLGEVVLVMRQTGPGGYFSKPVHLYHSEGTLTDYKGYFANGKFILYLIERSFQKDRLKRVTIPSGLLKFKKEKQ